MNNNGNSCEPTVEISALKRNLPDILTMSRLVSGFVVLGMSFIGASVYIAVVIITLAGAATDIFDGKAARRYLGGREGRLGKYDVEVDILFLLCVLGYFSLSGIVIHPAVGLGWIGLVLSVAALTRKDKRVLVGDRMADWTTNRMDHTIVMKIQQETIKNAAARCDGQTPFSI